MTKTFEQLPEVKKIEACENFIKAQFKKHDCKGIYTNLMFDMAEKAGLYIKGVYGSAFSQALENITNVESRYDVDGKYIFSVFTLK